MSTGADRDAVLHDAFVAHYAPMLRLATLLTGDRSAGEDVVQEAFVNLHRSLERVHGSLGAYLRTIVVNGARSRYRHLAVVERKPPPPAPDAVSAEDDAMLREDQREVIAALQKLSDRQRECLVLRYYGELSEAEIAQALGIAPGSVKTHTSRGMAALAAALEGGR